MVRLRDYLLLQAAFILLGLALCLFVRLALRPWWRRRGARAVCGALLALDLLVPGIWYLFTRLGMTHQADGLVTGQLGLFFGQIALGGGLVLAALLSAADRQRGRRDVAPQKVGRRRFLLHAAAVAIPVAAGAAGLGGVLASASPVRVRRRTLTVPGLPPALAGLRILHFADVHLWHLVRLPELEAALERAPRGEYDLVCVTGDLADDMRQLPRALEMIVALEAPLGHFACLGNHEHARGLPEALAAYAAGPVRLLRADHTVLRRGEGRFVLAGIDDPRARPRMAQNLFYPDQLARALGPAGTGDFTILLSHRPSVMLHAAAAGVDLVLAGHTHGGQMALAGRSILQLNGATRWAWGAYREGGCVMHVTCGLGQWFPFRLGCPPEMVLLELQPPRARSDGARGA